MPLLLQRGQYRTRTRMVAIRLRAGGRGARDIAGLHLSLAPCYQRHSRVRGRDRMANGTGPSIPSHLAACLGCIPRSIRDLAGIGGTSDCAIRLPGYSRVHGGVVPVGAFGWENGASYETKS